MSPKDSPNISNATRFLSQRVNDYIESKNKQLNASYLKKKVDTKHVLNTYINRPISIQPRHLRNVKTFLKSIPDTSKEGPEYEMTYCRGSYEELIDKRIQDDEKRKIAKSSKEKIVHFKFTGKSMQYSQFLG